MPKVSREIDPLVAALLGEAAGEGEEGLAFVRDVIVNRARAKKKSLEEIVAEPYQFSAYRRPDLLAFAMNQPMRIRQLAERLIAEARNPEFHPATPVQHYVTQDLFNRRYEPQVPSWIRKMKPVQIIGRHVALE